MFTKGAIIHDFIGWVEEEKWKSKGDKKRQRMCERRKREKNVIEKESKKKQIKREKERDRQRYKT